jgi:CheY-like chemotaxis protein
MKTILLGGLDAGLSELAAQAFEPYKNEYILQTVGSLGELLVLLKTSQCDLLFLDLDNPGGVALEWLAQVAELKASIPILGAGQAQRPDITGYELRFPDHFFPFLTYLRKPLTPQDILKAVEAEFRHAARGVIEGLSLATLLQMLHMEGKTCTIRVTSGRRQGFFYLRGGQIINARYRRLEGIDAALSLLASPSPKAEIDGQLHDTTQVIHARIEELMMEAMRLQDEGIRDFGERSDEEEADDPSDIPESETGKWDTLAGPLTKAPESAKVPEPIPIAPSKPKPRSKWYLWVAACVILPCTAIPFFIPKEEHIGIRSSPMGATVSLDGRSRGKTPLELTLAKPLQGSLKVELAGYEPQTHILKPGESSLAFTLKAVPPPPEPPPVVEPAPEPEPVPPPQAPKAKKPAPKAPSSKSKGDVFDQLRQP